MKKNFLNKLSMRMIVLISFIVFLVSTVFIVGYIAISNWLSASEVYIKNIANEINEDTNLQITNFINTPQQINKYYQDFIKSGMINIENSEERDKFFVSVLKQAPNNIYSFSYGTIDGEYYGARRNSNYEIEIIRNDKSTGGRTCYFSVNEDMTAGTYVSSAGYYDPRDQDWYKDAVKENGTIFSAVHQHFDINDLTITASYPIYVDGKLEGVLGTHTTLSNINKYLENIIDDGCITLIVEKDTNELIANSLNIKNFSNDNGSYFRTKVDTINNEIIEKGYEYYHEYKQDEFEIDYDGENYYYLINNYQHTGLDWVIIIIIPASLFIENITSSIIFTILLAIFAVVISIFIYYLYTKKFLLKPFYTLINSTERFAEGNLDEQIEIKRNDEIGKISQSFNTMAYTISKLVNDLESKVKERTKKLYESNKELKENRERLQLILDSTHEAIFGIDIEGKCTFCNKSCLKLLGYNKQEELLGKDIHSLIHYLSPEGKVIHRSKCNIVNALIEGRGIDVDDEVFWRADGTSIDVEYHSYPQFKNGEIVGGVVTFVDISSKKKNEEKIRFLSYHDFLTGLYNRNAFKEKLEAIDKKEYLPLTIIFGDVNGLKLTNDIFGHSAGDNLLKKAAEILKKVLRKDDIIARFGGDEFVIALPKTDEAEAEAIIGKIKEEFAREDTIAMMASISLGFETKTMESENIMQLLDSAEAWMYKDKMGKRKTTSIDTIYKIISLLHKRSPREKSHSLNVSLLCYDLGIIMGKTETEIRKLKDAGYFHDIGKIVLEENLLNYHGPFTDKQYKNMQQHTVIGYRILNLFDETLDIAEGVLYHHEKWNGQGYPKGLRGKEIPELARIIKICENYDFLVNRKKVEIEEALNEIEKLSGIDYDPDIVENFIKMIKERSIYKTVD